MVWLAQGVSDWHLARKSWHKKRFSNRLLEVIVSTITFEVCLDELGCSRNNVAVLIVHVL